MGERVLQRQKLLDGAMRHLGPRTTFQRPDRLNRNPLRRVMRVPQCHQMAITHLGAKQTSHLQYRLLREYHSILLRRWDIRHPLSHSLLSQISHPLDLPYRTIRPTLIDP